MDDVKKIVPKHCQRNHRSQARIEIKPVKLLAVQNLKKKKNRCMKKEKEERRNTSRPQSSRSKSHSTKKLHE